MGIENSKIKLGQDVEGASYAYDVRGNVIGWYDIKSKTLFISDKYNHKKELADQIHEHSIKHKIIPNVDEEMLDFFQKFHEKRLDQLKKHRKMLKLHEERVKLMPKRYKKVKNAKQKIKKRHE